MPRFFLSSFPVALSASFFAWRRWPLLSAVPAKPALRCLRLVLLIDFSVVFITRMIPHTFTWALWSVCFTSATIVQNPETSGGIIRWSFVELAFVHENAIAGQVIGVVLHWVRNWPGGLVSTMVAWTDVSIGGSLNCGKVGCPMVYPSQYSSFKPMLFLYIGISLSWTFNPNCPLFRWLHSPNLFLTQIDCWLLK